MDAKHLSKRLQKVAEFVPKNARIADIGSDHAYLPVNLALNHIIDFGIAGEVVRGPYENAYNEIKAQNLEHAIIPRLADGLAAILPSDKIDTITICGMGGTLIRKILNEGKEKLVNHPLLILQPNVGSDVLRQWLFEHQYEITNEVILDEDQHIYEILVAQYNPQVKSLSPEDLQFGVYLRHEKNAAYIKKWQKEIQKNNDAIEQMKKAKKVPLNRIKELENKNQYIKEVLNND